ncbi:hypothetical protein TYRP_006926 [Tyrophagus putrescentiae]|nr:hypothetical protein TYRP_006926 [Tyrophagus putrescentiae]
MTFLTESYDRAPFSARSQYVVARPQLVAVDDVLDDDQKLTSKSCAAQPQFLSLGGGGASLVCALAR